MKVCISEWSLNLFEAEFRCRMTVRFHMYTFAVKNYGYAWFACFLDVISIVSLHGFSCSLHVLVLVKIKFRIKASLNTKFMTTVLQEVGSLLFL